METLRKYDNGTLDVRATLWVKGKVMNVHPLTSLVEEIVNKFGEHSEVSNPMATFVPMVRGFFVFFLILAS